MDPVLLLLTAVLGLIALVITKLTAQKLKDRANQTIKETDAFIKEARCRYGVTQHARMRSVGDTLILAQENQQVAIKVE